MPLSELLYRMAAKGKVDSSQEKNPSCSTDLSFVPENDFVELVWENGQIQSSKARKIQTSSSLPYQSPKIRDREVGNDTYTRIGKFGMATESVPSEIPTSVPSVEIGLNQDDDDVVPWLNYQMDESLQHDYCYEVLPELSGVTVHEHSSQNNFASFNRRGGGNQSIRDSHTVSVPNNGDAVATRPRVSSSQLYLSSPQQCQTSFPNSRYRVLAGGDCSDTISNATHHTVTGNSVRIPTSGGGFPRDRMQKHASVLSTNNSRFMNFSHFAKPVALVKASIQNIGVRAGSGVSSNKRMEIRDKGSIPSLSHANESTFNDSYGGLQRETTSHGHPIIGSPKVDAKPLDAKPAAEPEPIGQEDDEKDDKHCGQDFSESAIKGWAESEKHIEPAVASSSVCSGNSVERVSDDPKQNLKRKSRDTEESEGPSEDVEEESVGVKKPAPTRGGTGSKRSRAAEVHNLSERRRRDRINEKMRALQELIPNCNKVDKASMLDEAIEYLKTLQLQVQIMSMGTGMYMPSMMLPPGIPPMHAAHMAQFSPMGVGMGMGMGMGMGYGMGMPDMNGGSTACSMIQVPPIHAAHFPGPPMSGPSALHGMGGSNIQMFGLSGQGLPVPFPHGPFMPMSGGPLMKTTMGLNACGVVGPADNQDSAPASCSKDSIQNINSQVVQNNGAKGSMHQPSSQCPVTDRRLEQSALTQSKGQASEAADDGTLKLANEKDDMPSRAPDCD